MIYPRLAFVDAPQLSANVRFDFNADGYMDPDFSAGDIAFDGSTADSVAPELALREVDFDAIFSGTRRRNHQMVSRLMRELMRPRNWLLWQMNADVEPMWFHTYASGFGSLDFQQVTRDGSDDFYALPLTIDADPDIRGAQESFSVTFTNDPATGGCYKVLPALKGDLPAPLSVDIGATGSSLNWSPYLSVSSVPSTYAALVIQLEGGTGVVPGSSTASDATASAGSVRIVSNAAATQRYTNPMTALGSYRLFIRAKTSGAGCYYNVRTNATEVPNTAGKWVWVDVGTYAVPLGSTVTGDVSVVLSDIYVHMQAPSGVTLTSDVLMAVPESLANSDYQAWAVRAGDLWVTVVDSVTVDSENMGLRGYVSGNVVDFDPNLTTARPSLVGAGVYGQPGQNNVAHLFLHTLADGTTDALTTSTAVTVTYYPRYLNLPGS